jgi:hypothetical protein
METIENFNDLKSIRESDEKYEDIENSIHNSLLYNKPTIKYNCNEFCYNLSFSVVPFGIVIIMVIIVMVIVAVMVNMFS